MKLKKLYVINQGHRVYVICVYRYVIVLMNIQKSNHHKPT